MDGFPLLQSYSDFGGGNRHGWWEESTWQTSPPSYRPTRSYSTTYLSFFGLIDVSPQRRTNENTAFSHYGRPVFPHKRWTAVQKNKIFSLFGHPPTSPYGVSASLMVSLRSSMSYRDWPWDQRSRSVIPQCNQNFDGTLNSRIPIFWMVTLGCAWINKSPLFINISTYWTQVNESTPERLSIAHTNKLSPWRDALWPYDGRVFSS